MCVLLRLPSRELLLRGNLQASCASKPNIGGQGLLAPQHAVQVHAFRVTLELELDQHAAVQMHVLSSYNWFSFVFT